MILLLEEPEVTTLFCSNEEFLFMLLTFAILLAKGSLGELESKPLFLSLLNGEFELEMNS